MKSIIRWAVNNAPAMNTIMVGVLCAGLFCLVTMRREVFPEFDLEIILVTVPYPQASPDEVEEGICQKIEEAVRSIEGIKKQFSVAKEGAGNVILELHADVPDVQKVLNEVRSEVDRIPSLPERAEDPEIQQLTLREAAINLAVIAPEWEFEEIEDPELRAKLQLEAQLELREVAESVRDDLLLLPSVSQAEITGARDFQIDVEISEATLREHNLSLAEVARRIRRENVELPGGRIKTDSQEILLRGKNKQTVGTEIAKIPIVNVPGGKPLTVGDLGNVRDAFIDTTSINQVNGKPAMVISVNRTSKEDLLAMADAVRKYAASHEAPNGYRLETWMDRSVDVHDRMDLLIRNGLQGLALVFLVLAIFLEFKLAFWVALGIPVAVLGSGIPLVAMGHTLNMLSMFAFLMALGIVVDDAIVVGENIYSHRQAGKGFVRAAIDGTYEVLPAVMTSIGTTIIAFVPLMFVAGVMGKFIAVMPVAVIAMLILSLAESMFVLPCHLAHTSQEATGRSLAHRAHRWRRELSPGAKWSIGPIVVAFAAVVDFFIFPFRVLIGVFHWLNVRATKAMTWLIQRTYLPSLRWSLNNPGLTVALSISLLLVTFGTAKRMNFNVMPKLDSKWIEAKVIFPDGTPAKVTDQATRQIEKAIFRVDDEIDNDGRPLVKMVHRAVGTVSGAGVMGPNTRSSGGHVGAVNVELVEVEHRNLGSAEITRLWREATGEIAGADSVKFGAPQMGPGGIAIEFKLFADKEHFGELEKAVEETKVRLAKFDGVFDIDDDSRPGKPEFQLAIRDDAKELGVSVADVAETVRAAYYGDEVMRLQRGRHEVKLMVRYPKDERQSLAAFEELRVRIDDGVERYVSEVAEIRNERGYSEINRVDQQRSITITADVDESRANADRIVTDLKDNFLPGLFEKYPEVQVLWEGQAQSRQESMQSLMIGLVAALVAMFVLLTLQFRSYFQPLLILAIIPFGFVGAIFGHALMGMDLTLFTMFGLVALTGVVVNDSIVLMDFINKRVNEGVPIKEALLDAGHRRFRPILLTSFTTVAGLFPILTETSFQAQILIPMAAALCFGLISATGLILILVPTFYYIYASTVGTDADVSVLEEAPVAMLEAPASAVIQTDTVSSVLQTGNPYLPQQETVDR
ncbi:MAG: efflux RND transporter permease subunit [Pirellulales bacterium]|nr:efflux RND transporter permease subunit [Pirellulales bacterium]